MSRKIKVNGVLYEAVSDVDEFPSEGGDFQLTSSVDVKNGTRLTYKHRDRKSDIVYEAKILVTDEEVIAQVGESLHGENFDVITVGGKNTGDPAASIEGFLRELSSGILGFRDMLRNTEPEIMLSTDGLEKMRKSVYRYVKDLHSSLKYALSK